MNKVFTLLKIEADERRSVVLIMLLSFFLGVFNGTFYIGSHSQFLDTFGKDEIANAYVISGVVGIVMTFIYAFFQSRISFSALSKWNLIMISLMAFALRLAYDYMDPSAVDFAYFVLYGPLNILAVVAFWGMVNRIYSLRQGKRLFGIIDAGIIFGIIISSISIPLIPILFGYQIGLRDLIYVSSGSTVLAFFFQWIIASKYLREEKQEKSSTKKKDKEKSSLSLLKLFKGKYTRAMAIFVGISVVVAFFAQFSFMAVAEERYPDAYELANFLGVFTTALMVVTFLIKTFVYNRLVDSFGLKTSLMALPLILAVLTVGAVLIGTFSNLTLIESQGFLSFFLIISLSKLLAQSLKEGIELPSFKLLYHSVKSQIRHDVQAKIDGTVNEIFALLSGGLLALLGFFAFVEIEHYSYVLCAILILWVFSAIRLYKEYKNSLKASLDSAQVEKAEVEDVNLAEALKQHLNEMDPQATIGMLKLIKRVDSLHYSDSLASAFQVPSDQVKKYVEKEIVAGLDNSAISLVEKSMNSKSEVSAIRKEVESNIKSSLPNLHELSVSGDRLSRLRSAILLRNATHKESGTILYRLIRDVDPTIKSEAIITAASNGHTELAVSIIEMLSHPKYGSIAFSSLQHMGDKIIDALEVSFNKTGIDQVTQMRLIELLGNCKSKKADKLLLKKISHPHRMVVYAAIEQLEKRDPDIEGDTEYLLLNVLNELIGSIALTLTVINSLDDNIDHYDVLKNALEIESSNNYVRLFSILKLLYDAKSVVYVEENLKDGSPESIGFAMELLELFISEDLKPKLFPLFEDITLANRVRKLLDYFPIEHVDKDNCIQVILSQDISEISAWSKCIAMHTQDDEIDEGLLSHFKSNVFGKSPILYETAGYLLAKNNNEALTSVADRIPFEKLSQINKLRELVEKENRHLIFRKMLYLTEHPIFSMLNIADKLIMAEHMKLVTPTEDRDLLSDVEMLFVAEGAIRFSGKNKKLDYIKGNLIHLDGMGSDSYDVAVDTETVLYSMPKGSFAELTNRPSFVEAWLRYKWTGIDNVA
jgi:ATP:ADP antiporter, AAA family